MTSAKGIASFAADLRGIGAFLQDEYGRFLGRMTPPDTSSWTFMQADAPLSRDEEAAMKMAEAWGSVHDPDAVAVDGKLTSETAEDGEGYTKYSFTYAISDDFGTVTIFTRHLVEYVSVDGENGGF